MLTAKPEVNTPQLKGTITPPAYILGRIIKTVPEIKGTIHRDTPQIKGTISNDIKRESYYEVSNDYGITIIIGD